MPNLPNALVEQVRVGQAVLFLGAGASYGATHPHGNRIPLGPQLAKSLAEKFLDDSFVSRPLSEIAELAISEYSLTDVQEHLADILDLFGPASFHKLIPTFRWAGIATTNYDQIIEKAYEGCSGRIQHVRPIIRSTDRVDRVAQDADALLYLKLHGCTSAIRDPRLPLILTPEQYVTHRRDREHLFTRLEEWSYSYPFIFVGYRVADLDIRHVLLQLSQLADARPRSYLICPGITEADSRFWATRKISCMDMTFEDLLTSLDVEINRTFRRLALGFERDEHPINRRFATVNARPTRQLIAFLERDCDYIHTGMRSTQPNPPAFYKGYFGDWSPLEHDLDVRRKIVDDVLSEVILSANDQGAPVQQLCVIKGHAGAGKSVVLSRLAWEAGRDFGLLCLFIRSSLFPDFDIIAELHHLCRQRIFLFIDDFDLHAHAAQRVAEACRRDRIPLSIVGAAQPGRWNRVADLFPEGQCREYVIRYLNEKEIDGLIDLLTQHNSLYSMKDLSREKQRDLLKNRAGRQLLVALHEATLGKPFEEIIREEYEGISSAQAKSIYLTVCILHRLGISIRAGIIARIHGVPFDKFQNELLSPLESIVRVRRDRYDALYESRHAHIAQMVFESILINPEVRHSEYKKILSALDPGYGADLRALKGLLKARSLIELFSKKELIEDLYRSAYEHFPNNPYVLHQHAIYVMKVSDEYDRAQEILHEARRLAPQDLTIKHSIAELALKRAERAPSRAERKKWAQECRDYCTERSEVSHDSHTRIKIGIIELEDVLEYGDEKQLKTKIKGLERTIQDAIQRFPGDSYILESEARYCQLLGNRPRQVGVMRKAFDSNPKSSYLALRLAGLYSSEGRVDDAIEILQRCLEEVPMEKDVHFRLAQLLTHQKGHEDREVLLHLRQSFTKNDSRYGAQFEYARLAYLLGDYAAANEVFRSLGRVEIRRRDLLQVRWTEKRDGLNVLHSGVIDRKKGTYALIKRERSEDLIFASEREFGDDLWAELRIGARVAFSLGFNFKGPVALEVRHR